MRRFLPYPLMTAALILMWLLLAQSVAPAQILLGVGVAVAATWVMSLLEVEPPRIRFTVAIPRLAFIVLHDIIRSNIAVARIVLTHRTKSTSGLVRIPLETQNRYCLALLAIIVTSTPGTLWIEHDSRRNTLLLHVLDLVDERHWIDLIKQRYERLLMEIFK